MRVIVMWSGGKDSHACLIQSVERYGADNVTAVFCDTGWEHKDTLKHVKMIADANDVELVTLKPDLNFSELVIKKRMFPSFVRRYCTIELKVKPFVDWLLTQEDNFIVVQGIRAEESQRRAKYEVECDYFKPWHTGEATYRKREILEFASRHDVSVSRPIFKWNGQQVVDFILKHGQEINPLYMRGSKRVGCYPCVFCNKRDIKNIANDEEYAQRLIDLERQVELEHIKHNPDKVNVPTFFRKGTIPEELCKRNDNGVPTAKEVFAYVKMQELGALQFDDDNYSCMSVYHGLCE
ncbi:phosphoadenosine phosphosulfate reductase domain-containing protein [Porphyromonas somerae]|uniref:phosphoadenosine phosphosulfate reductase domain-containing protein n=1 Tax=Porphyromonas somerae TaxID=322095 RepID=UPI0003660B21|nr:phosphoadenosine phosphosulfate reductase family protein [Porphyromonas somerae]